jgi:hypothetical protein
VLRNQETREKRSRIKIINKPKYDAWNYRFYALFLMGLPYSRVANMGRRTGWTGSRSKNEFQRSRRVPDPDPDRSTQTQDRGTRQRSRTLQLWYRPATSARSVETAAHCEGAEAHRDPMEHAPRVRLRFGERLARGGRMD